MKVVIDTNVFISGIFWEGNYSSQIIEAWKNKKFTLITSITIIEELINTLRNFKKNMPEEMIKEWEDTIIRNSEIIQISSKIHIVTEDPDDDKFIETAIKGNADFIITQDKHLLKIKDYQEIIILTPKEFLEKNRTENLS